MRSPSRSSSTRTLNFTDVVSVTTPSAGESKVIILGVGVSVGVAVTVGVAVGVGVMLGVGEKAISVKVAAGVVGAGAVLGSIVADGMGGLVAGTAVSVAGTAVAVAEMVAVAVF